MLMTQKYTGGKDCVNKLDYPFIPNPQKWTLLHDLSCWGGEVTPKCVSRLGQAITRTKYFQKRLITIILKYVYMYVNYIMIISNDW